MFAQVEGIDITMVPDGYVVYDPRRDRVHYLNHTAALVLELCTGANSLADIAAVLQKAFDLSETPEQVAKGCLDQLSVEGLITVM